MFIVSKLKAVLRRISEILQYGYSVESSMMILLIRSRKPEDFETKILNKMARDREPKLRIFADKVLAREYVKKLTGDEFISEYFEVHQDLNEFKTTAVPNNIVIKSNHGSGAMIIIQEYNMVENPIVISSAKNDWERYVTNSKNVTWDEIESVTNKWMNQSYFWNYGKYPEWAYRNIQPKIIFEEVMLCNGDLPIDYKFYMLHGKCEFIHVDINRFGVHKRNLYDHNFDPIHSEYRYPTSSFEIEKPEEFKVMIDLAKVLSRESDFLRVDLYETNKGVRFGELTNYPEGGKMGISDRLFSREIASRWHQNY